MKPILGIPLIFTIAAFTCSLLSLLAGFKKGFMEDYNVMTLNTSALGEDAIRAIANGSISSPTLTALGIGSDAASNLLKSMSSNLAGDLASQLGISEFYTIHAMDFCQGNFDPSPTAVGASYNVTSCSAPLDFAAYNLTSKLEQELSVGPYHFTLSQLGVSKDTQDKLGYLPIVARVLAGLSIVTVGATAGSMFATALGVVLIPARAPRRLSLLNTGAAALAVVFTLASGLVATFVPRGIAAELQTSLGDTVGLEIVSNLKLPVLTWAACGMAVLATLSWFCELIVQCVQRRRTGGFMQRYTSSFEK